MTAVSGHGPWPGDGAPLEAQLTVLGDLAAAPTGAVPVPFLVRLPGRGPGAQATGRTAALLTEMPVELGVHGWKLASHEGADLRRATALLAEDVEALAIAAAGYDGPLALSVTGPWTLAAELYLAHGDRVLADRGAVRELVESLSVGLAEHVASVRRQVPGAGVVVQVEEPLLSQVHAGVLPTFSGYSRLRAVAGPDLVDGLRPVLDAVRDAGARSVVHVGPAWVGVAPVVLSGADAVGLDLAPSLDAWNEPLWETVAKATERGVGLWAGLPPAQVSQCSGPGLGTLADLVSVPWRRIGLPVDALDDVTVLGAGHAARAGGGLPDGVAPGGVDAHRAALGNLGRVAAILAERAHD
ncbi:hypothetical protein [Oerskovia flava]|uniref:hypothetical protein n=1 Tax=Oerskovia flava TaxID=2986422 RepID=UPI002240DC58|nr:hypothetical protein [Oerskovia sp. JB1-3-2]